MVTLADLHQEIRTAIENGEIERPQRICRSILAVRPGNLETLLLEAELHLETGEPRLAIAGFESVLAGDPEAYLAYAGLAIAYESLRDPSAALHWFTRAFDLEPQNREVRRERDRLFQIAYPGLPMTDGLSDLGVARSFVAAGFGAKALDTYHIALQHEPGRLEIRLGLAELLWVLSRTTEAEAMCHLVLSIAPHAVKAHALLACIAAERGDLERGRQLLAPVHTQDPAGRIAMHLIQQTQLAQWATDDINLDVSPGSASRSEHTIEAPAWATWMRHALWQVLRLVIPPEEPALPVPVPAEPGARSGGEGASGQENPRPPRPLPATEQRISTTGPLGRRLQAVGVGITAEATGPRAEDQHPSRAESTDTALVSEEVVRVSIEPVLEARRRARRAARAPRTDAADVTPPPA